MTDTTGHKPIVLGAGRATRSPATDEERAELLHDMKTVKFGMTWETRRFLIDSAIFIAAGTIGCMVMLVISLSLLRWWHS